MKIALPLLVLLSAAPVFAVPVSLTVVDDKGKPVAGADVQLESFGKTPRGFVLHQTNEQGIATFDVEPLPNTPYKDVAGRIFARKNGLGISNGWLEFKKPLRLELPVATKISGTVVDTEGKPIKGAAIAFLSAEKDGDYSDILTDGPLLPQMTTHSGADGSWQLDGVPANTKVTVAVSATERVSVRTEILPGASGQTVLLPGAQIKGRVLGLDGKPLAGIYVSAQGSRNSPNASDSGSTTKSGADGTFLLDGLKNGNYNVSLSPEDRELTFVIAAFENVNASVGQPHQLPDAKAIEGVLIGGHVRDSVSKAALSSVEIGVYGGVNPASSAAVARAITDENGAWNMRTVPGPSKVYVMGPPQQYKRDQQIRDLTIAETGDTNLDFNLEPLPKITGRLLDEQGKGVKANLRLQQNNNELLYISSDEKGDFTSYGATDGDWTIVSDEGWEPVGPIHVRIAPDKPLEIHLRHVQLGTVEIGVYDDDDAAIEGARVAIILQEGEGGMQHEMISDKLGRAHYEGVRADQTVIIQSAQKQGYDTAALPTPTHVGRTWNATVTLVKRGGRASGQVFGTNGEVAAGALVSASGLDTRADANGNFTLTPLPKGVMPLFAWKENGFALSSTDKTRLDLKPQTLEPTNPTKAKEILDILADQAKDVEYYRRDSLEYEVGSFDELSKRLQQNPAKGAITTLIARFGNDQTIPPSRWFPVVRSAKEASRRLYDTSEWIKTGPAIENNEDTRQFLQALQDDVTQAEPLFKSDDKWMVGHGIFAAAAIAEKIGDTKTADALFERARAFTEKAYGRESDRDYGIIGPIVAASPRLLLKAAALLPDTNGNRALLLSQGATTLARTVGLDAIKPFLDQIHDAPEAKPDSYGDTMSTTAQWREATTKSILAAGKTNPALALELAKALPANPDHFGDDSRDVALCEAAFFQAPEVGHQLWRESLPHLNPDKAMGFVVRILKIDEPFASEQYKNLAANMDAIPLPNPADGWRWYAANPAEFAFYEARFNPARARFRLERAFAAAQANPNAGDEIPTYARAMAVFDVTRALSWTARSAGAINSPGGNFAIRRRIAQWLVLDDEARQNTAFSP